MFARSMGKFLLDLMFDGTWIEIWIDGLSLMDMEMIGMAETLDGIWLVCSTESAFAPLYTVHVNKIPLND